LRVVYGMTSRKEIDDYVQIAYRASESAFTMNHGTFFVDYFPLLKRIPGKFLVLNFLIKYNLFLDTFSLVSWCIIQA